MIKVDRIKVVEFRGIRDLTIDLNGANFAVCGPNGTGKSGVVDGLELGLSGTISRLTGKGQGAVSVKDHGPHVNSRNQPEKAVATIDVTIPSLGGKMATITRKLYEGAPLIKGDYYPVPVHERSYLSYKVSLIPVVKAFRKRRTLSGIRFW